MAIDFYSLPKTIINVLASLSWDNPVVRYYLSIVLYVILFFVFLLLWSYITRPRGIPPGPLFTFPIIGDIVRIMGRGDIYKKFRTLRCSHGDIFSFYLGGRLLIVLNGITVIKKALVHNAEHFSYRPHLFLTDEQRNAKGEDITDLLWKQQRHFSHSTLKAISEDEVMLEQCIKDEVRHLLDAIEQHEKVFEPRQLITNAVFNIMCVLCFANRFDYNDKSFENYLRLLGESFKSYRNTHIVNFFPWLKCIPRDMFHYKQILEMRYSVENEFLSANIRLAEEALDEEKADDIAINKNFTTMYLKEMRRRKEDPSSTMDEMCLKRCLGSLLSMGTDSTSETLCMAMQYFMHYPKIQEKCFLGIQHHVGLDRLPSLADIKKIPYLEATIMEIMRHADFTPLAHAYVVNSDIKFMGHRLPKEAIILPNLASIMKDPKCWKDPDIFHPSRFMDDLANLIRQDRFIPFSIGPRRCIGKHIAKPELSLFLASLLQTYRLEKPENVKSGLSHGMPIKVNFIRRDNTTSSLVPNPD